MNHNTDTTNNNDKLTNKSNHNHKGKFAKGNNANPTGRPKKENTWNDIIEDILDSAVIDTTIWVDGAKKKMRITAANTFKHTIIMKLLQKALREKGDIRAMEMLLDRSLGKPKQQTDLTNAGEKFQVPQIFLPDNGK